MPRRYDAVIAGGSIAGLAFASEAAELGLSVLVAEQHEEIGEPEKCDGLVSLRGLRTLGYLPRTEAVQNRVSTGLIHSPDGRSFAVNATALEVVVLDRSAYDKQVAETARSRGAEVLTGSRVTEVVQGRDEVTATVGGEKVAAAYLVDATGPASAPRSGILPAAKYEIEADWVRERVVEVFPDAQKFPGFFAWVIPFGRHLAKVGAAGMGTNPFKALDAFLSDKPHTVIRKVSAPIYVGGPAPHFVAGRTVFVGESAGQVKPTTAGGIMTSIAGAAMAARRVADAVRSGEPRLLGGYRRDWDAKFVREMKAMLRLRRVFTKMSNRDIETLFNVVATPKIVMKLARGDFDFHASALLGALGVQGLLNVAKLVATSEVRALLSERRAAVSQQSI